MNNILHALNQIVDQYTEGLPLAQFGVEKDWVCVLNRPTYQSIGEWLDEQPPFAYQEWADPVERVVQRRVMLIDAAPNGANYMSESEMFQRYKDHFLDHPEDMQTDA
jgi:hypothetical protein